ncbi:MAG TPA: glycoside hydrolase family 3 N-terminal domain-containing protein [Gemmatimonadaceae bacterium]|nr:glycoside hydrolase family 3 N-terminal domain-containing protein [Gemmatimonadaceae bacterium]
MATHPLHARSLAAAALLASLGAIASCAHSGGTSAPTTTTVAVIPPRPAPTPLPATPTPLPGPFDPRTALTARQAKWIDSTLASLPLRERIGQMVMVWVLGDYTSYGDSTFAEVRRWIERDHIGGVSMSLGTPIEVAAKINNMQRLSRVPLLSSADLEPGLGRLEGGVFTHYLLEAGSATVFPSAMAIAATGREQDAYDAAKIIGQEARAVGIQINFSPVVDVNNNPSNPVINTRSFGEDPQRVALLSAQFVRGTQDGGAISTAKHFPGHGDTDVDSHVGLPVVGANWARLTQVELVPFKAAIDAGAGMVMTAHIALPAVEGDSTTPATLAPRIITGVLRDTLKFRGVAITDAMTMEGVGKGYGVEESTVLAVKAGADIILKPSDPTKAIDAVLTAVERGDISRARIDSAARRVLDLKARTGVAFNRLVDLDALREVVGSAEHRATAEGIARRAVTLLRDTRSQLPVTGRRIAVVQYMPETELRAGKIFGNELRAAFPATRVIKISPSTSATDLDSVTRQVAGADRVVVAAYVRRIEGEGRPAVPPHIAKWIDDLAKKEKVVAVALGNPYLIRQFPSVSTYLVTYGVGDALERAAAAVVLGRAPAVGTAPVSLPGFFKRGDGVKRDAAGSR